METLETLETARGNTSNSRVVPSKYWFFTYNNYTEEKLEILETFLKKNTKYVFQKEIGECGTPHLQGGFICDTKIRPIEKIGIKEIHFEKQKGSWKDVVQYCTKEDTREKGTKPYTNIPLPRKDTRFNNWINKPWQQYVENIIKTEPDDRTVYWFYDINGGIGKSSFCKYLIQKYNDVLCVSSTKSADILTAVNDTVKTFIIDIPRVAGDFCPFNAIEQIKNGMITNGKLLAEAKIITFAPPHVIIFANKKPDPFKLSIDRWVIKDLTDSF